MPRKAIVPILLQLTMLMLASCGSVHPVASYDSLVDEATAPPEQTGDGWSTARLADHAIADAPIESMLRALDQNHSHGISSILIARDGDLVFEKYFGSQTRDEIHNTSSAAKSITSALVGIAIDKGFIASEEQRVLPYFPEYTGRIANWDPRKDNIRIADILSMTSGMKCDEDAMYETDDWVKFYLDQPMVQAPSNVFSYNTCGVVVLGSIIKRASGLRVPAFAQRYLFEPMGIANVKWPITNSLGSQGLAMTGGGLSLRPRDMAKFGQLILNNGVWAGEQLLSTAWITASTRKHATSDLHGEDYGYLWRMIDRNIGACRTRSYEAWGNGGQFIMVFPSLRLVVVFTGENYGKFPEMELPFELVDRYILPAVCST
jgi:CubicO group peptidase (beta-lactamase class C family)